MIDLGRCAGRRKITIVKSFYFYNEQRKRKRLQKSIVRDNCPLSPLLNMSQGLAINSLKNE